MRVLAVIAAAAATVCAYTGVIDTVGGTTFEDQGSGPAYQWVVRDPVYGLHACWMYSAQASNWPDRNVRYNFYDYTTGQWNWVEPSEFMSSGTNSRTQRCGYGTMDLMPSDGAALIACHYAPAMMQFAPTALRDIAPGAGVFDECVGAPDLTGWFLPVVGITASGTICEIIIQFQTSDNLFFTRTTPWCTWETPAGWSQTGAFGQNLFASKTSEKLLATWMTGSNSDLELHYRYSTDAGASWDAIQQLIPPPAYGGDTTTVCFQGGSGLFDRDDNWLTTTVLAPVVADSAYLNPAQLWLYNSNTNEWHRIHRFGAASLAGGLGSSAICSKPSLGQNPASGRLYVAWEQFDSLNVEPGTNLLRADIWLSASNDEAVWREPFRLTVPNTGSKRFPRIAEECSGDSLAVGFIVDSIAGFNSGGTGGLSRNPVCVWRGSGVGIAEERRVVVEPARAAPNPGLHFTMQATAGTRAVYIRDAAGRLVREVEAAAGRAAWDGCDESGQRVESGCYWASWTGPAAGKMKLIVAR